METLQTKSGKQISIVYDELKKMYNIPLGDAGRVIELLGSIATVSINEVHQKVNEIIRTTINTKQS